MKTFKIGIIGVGKIVEDQHLPVIAKNPGFELAAVASQRGVAVPGARTFRTPAEMYAAIPDLDAVAVCTPPQVRHAFAREALAAGKDVLLEKPSTATLSELVDLEKFAAEKKLTLFTTWHSQYNAAVDAAQARLAGKAVKSMTITWKEDVRRWHPGPEMDLDRGRLRRLRSRHQRALDRDQDHAGRRSSSSAPIWSSRRTATRRSPPRSISVARPPASASAPSSTGARPASRPGRS